MSGFDSAPKDVAYSPELVQIYAAKRENFRDTDATSISTLQQVGVSGKKVLDVGCGDGIHCKLLADMGAASVVGVDLSNEFIDYAKEHNAAPGISYHAYNAADIPFVEKHSQELIFSNMAIHCCEDLQPVFTEIARTLSRDGTAVLVFNNYTVDPGYEHVFNTVCPVRLGPEDSTVIVQNIMRPRSEAFKCITAAKLQIMQEFEVLDRHANVSKDYEHHGHVHKHAMMYVLKGERVRACGLTETEMLDLWGLHNKYEFGDRDVDATMTTMTAEPYNVCMPTRRGGNGGAAVRAFYSKDFVTINPPDIAATVVSTTVGETQVVEENVCSFTHTVDMPWILPGVQPTGKKVRIPLVVIVGFENGLVSSEHIYWDGANVMNQVGLLEKTEANKQLVQGAEMADCAFQKADPIDS